jgi:GntR family transcriptional regulator
MAQQQQPRYVQIADDLRQQIDSGELPRESQIPTEVELQKKFNASRNTVRDAVKLLVQEGLLESRGGREGTWVTKAHIPFVTTLSTDPNTGLGGGGEEGATYPEAVHEQGCEAGADAPEVKIVRCPPDIAAGLNIPEGEHVVSRHQDRYIDGTIWTRQTSYYPFEWVTRGATSLPLPESIPEGAVKYLETIGLKQQGYRDLISARLPDDKERSLFNLTHSHTVIEVFRTSFAQDGTPIRVTVTVFPSDRNQIAYNIGVVPDHIEAPVTPERPSTAQATAELPGGGDSRAAEHRVAAVENRGLAGGDTTGLGAQGDLQFVAGQHGNAVIDLAVRAELDRALHR